MRREVANWGDKGTPFQMADRNPIMWEEGESDLKKTADGHLGYYGYLRLIDARLWRVFGVGLLDLPDFRWLDHYEDRVHPLDAIEEFKEENSADLRME